MVHVSAAEDSDANVDTYSGIKVAEYIDRFLNTPESTTEYFAFGYYGSMQAKVVKVYLETPIAGRSYIYNLVNIADTANNGYLLIDARDVEAFIAYFGRTNNRLYIETVKQALDSKGALVTLQGPFSLYTFYSFAEVAQAAGGSPGDPLNLVSRGTNPVTYQLQLTNYHRYEDRYQHQIGLNAPSQAKVGTTVEIELTATDGSYFIVKPQLWLVTISGPNGLETLMDYSQVYFSGHSHTHKLSYTFTKPGKYVVAFSIIEDASCHNNARTGTERYSISQSIDVADQLGPEAEFTWSPTSPIAGQNVDFTDTSTHPDGLSIVKWHWKIDAQSVSAAQHPSHGFPSAGTYYVELTVWDESGKSDTVSHTVTVTSSTPTPDPKPTIPPVACIQAPTSVTAGDMVSIESCSTDTDGEIVQLTWNWTGKGNPSIVSGELENNAESGYLVYLSPGTQYVYLTVRDNDGLTHSTEHRIDVHPPYPVALMTIGGTPKENRKVTLDASQSYGQLGYPIDTSKTVWEITPLDGQAAASIKFKGYTNIGHTKEVLFKEPGRYSVLLKVYNTYGNYGQMLQTITITEDLSPVVRYTVPAVVFRDPANNNKATFTLKDNSYSPDGDTIKQRIWKVLYDSQNDGRLENDTWVIIDSGNKTEVKYEASQVGHYYFTLEVVEGFGQETIPEFITASDYKRASD